MIFELKMFLLFNEIFKPIFSVINRIRARFSIVSLIIVLYVFNLVQQQNFDRIVSSEIFS